MSTSSSLYLSSEIVRVETVEDKLCLWSADGTQFEIPLSMLGQFRIPFAPTADAELLILNTAPVVKSVSVSDEALHVTFADGRSLSAPLHWFPRLLHGTLKERQAVEIWGETGLHWEGLDEDIDAVQLFRMMGPSVESEASIQRWLSQRGEQQEGSHSNLDLLHRRLSKSRNLWQTICVSSGGFITVVGMCGGFSSRSFGAGLFFVLVGVGLILIGVKYLGESNDERQLGKAIAEKQRELSRHQRIVKS